MPTIHLVRHAIALDQDSWQLPDELRPLTEFGWRQAVAIAEVLGRAEVQHFRASPTVRCIDTLLPSAHQIGLEVIPEPVLFETNEPSGDAAAAELLRELISKCLHGGVEHAAVCSHGNVLLALLTHLPESAATKCPKGGVWRVDLTAKDNLVQKVAFVGRLHPETGAWMER